MPDRHGPSRAATPGPPARDPPPEVLKEFDKDGDGKLTDEEREAAMATPARP